MKKNNKTQTNTTKHDHPGRPRHTMKWPKSMCFTFTAIMDANGCDTKPGKHYGKKVDEKGCTMLTCRKNLEQDMFFHKPGSKPCKANRTRVNPRSQVVLIHDVTAEPESESGLGRRALLYCLRVNKDSVTATPRKASTPKVGKAPRKVKTVISTSQTPTADVLDKIHAALATSDPVPAPALTVPAVTIAPEVTPAPAPVAETSVPEAAPAVAPVATESANAETAAVAAEATTVS